MAPAFSAVLFMKCEDSIINLDNIGLPDSVFAYMAPPRILLRL